MTARLPRPLTLEILLSAATDPTPDTGCRLWTRSTNGRGYPTIHYQGRNVGVHRLVMVWSYGYELHEVPTRIQTRHMCHEPLCINPDHLLAGHARENNQDSVRAGRMASSFIDGKCQAGHDITKPGAIYEHGRHRYCVACNREAKARRWRARRVAAA